MSQSKPPFLIFLVLITVIFSSVISVYNLFTVQNILTQIASTNTSTSLSLMNSRLTTITNMISNITSSKTSASSSNMKFLPKPITISDGVGSPSWTKVTVSQVPSEASAIIVMLSTNNVGNLIMFRSFGVVGGGYMNVGATWTQTVESTPNWVYNQGFITLEDKAFEYKTQASGGQVVIDLIGWVV